MNIRTLDGKHSNIIYHRELTAYKKVRLDITIKWWNIAKPTNTASHQNATLVNFDSLQFDSLNIHQALNHLPFRRVINKIGILDSNSYASAWLYPGLLVTFMRKTFLFNHLLAILFPVVRNAHLYSLCVMLHNCLWYSA